MIIQGSLNHSPSGRKKKAYRTVRKASPAFKPLNQQRYNTRETPHYPSAPMTPYKPAQDTSYKQEVSKDYTVSIAFNKGAYQVIPNSEVKHIGK